jgi:hypothetical protein
MGAVYLYFLLSSEWIAFSGEHVTMASNVYCFGLTAPQRYYPERVAVYSIQLTRV